MSNNKLIDNYINQRNKALLTLDMNWARKVMPTASNDHVRLIAMHKTRVEIRDMPLNLRMESASWLKAHNYSKLS